MNLLKSLLLAYATLFFIIGCQKEINRQEQPSQGTLQEDASGNCSPFTAAGTFRESTVLNSTHFIEVQVSITEPGSYSISSDTINGYSFSAVGFIDVPGTHTVRLAGSGTPIGAGLNSFMISYNGNINATACLVEITVLAFNPPAVYTFGTAGSLCTGALVSGTYTAGTQVGVTNTVSVSVNVSSLGSYNINTAIINGLSFSASGDFVSTGIQVVLLAASGTPTAAGVSNYSLTGNSNTCSFPVTVEGGQAAAIFTLVGAGGTCTNFIGAGNYVIGIPLGASHTVSITVNVTTVGAYTINTNSANGVSFTSSGNFSTIGPKTIFLTGTGTPLVVGTFNYTVTAGNNTCTFQAAFYNPIPTPPTGQAVYTFVGEPGFCTAQVVAGSYTIGTPLNSTNTVTVRVNVTTVGTYMIACPSMFSTNNLSFIKTGSFTTTGIQDLVFTGAGIPTEVGIHQFSPSAPSVSSCNFYVKTTAQVPTDFMVAKIGLDSKTFNVQSGATYLIPSSKLSMKGLASAGSQESFTLEIDRSSTGAGITAMAYNNNPSGGIKLSMTHVDATGAIWKTSDGSVNPTGGILIIITNISSTRVEGMFDTRVWNNGGNGPLFKLVRDGSFSIPIQ